MRTKSNENARNDEQLTQPQTTALASLLGGQTFGEAAAAAGVTPSTLWRWRHENPAFIASLAQHQAEARQRIDTALARLADRAVEALAAVLTDPGTSPADRCRAACAVLDRLPPAPSVKATDEIQVADACRDRERTAMLAGLLS